MKYFIPILAFPLLNCSVAMEPAPDKMVMEQKSTFDQVKQLYNTYQSESDLQLKMKTKSQIVSLLYHLLKMGEIGHTNRREAIEIAKGIDATTLAIRLEESSSENPFSTLPQELIDYILELISQGSDLKQIKEMLTVSKSFNKMFFTFPLQLDLSEKNISDDTLMKIVSIFPNLSSLNLRSTGITDAGLAHLQGLPNLSSLNLVWCTGITDAGLAHLQGLTNLSSLNLNFTGIGDAGLIHLQRLANLSSLELKNTEITDDGLAHLQRLPNLSSLNLGGCKKITDAGLIHLQKLPNLSSLTLAWCEGITDAGLIHLQKLPNLSSLDLSFNEITNVGLANLQELPNLSSLTLELCKRITDAGLADLRDKKPDLQINR